MIKLQMYSMALLLCCGSPLRAEQQDYASRLRNQQTGAVVEMKRDTKQKFNNLVAQALQAHLKWKACKAQRRLHNLSDKVCDQKKRETELTW